MAELQVDGMAAVDLLSTDVSQKSTYYDDFLGDTLLAELLAGVGSGTGNAVALIAGAQGGRVQVKTSSADAADSANASSISLGSTSYRADAGGLVLETRVQLDAVTSVGMFLGFTDTLASTVEVPIFLIAAAPTSTATDACGVCFDTDGSTAQWFHGGVKTDVDTAYAYSGTAPAANTWDVIRVEVSAAGAVQGFVNGVAIGPPIANAVAVTIPLTPVLLCINRSAAARNMLVDYLWVQQNR